MTLYFNDLQCIPLFGLVYQSQRKPPEGTLTDECWEGNAWTPALAIPLAGDVLTSNSCSRVTKELLGQGAMIFQSCSVLCQVPELKNVRR